MRILGYHEISFKNLSREFLANGKVGASFPERKRRKVMLILNRLEACFESHGRNYFVKLFLSMKLFLVMFSLFFVDRPMRGIPGFYIAYKPIFTFQNGNILVFSKT